MSALEDLRALVAEVESNIARKRAELQADIDRGRLSGPPELVTDMHGRPLILDAQIALLNARAVLAAHE